MTSNISDVRSAVKKIAWGFFLVHINFKLGPVDIFPDWVGFALIVSALAFVVAFEKDLKKLRAVGIILLAWSVIFWIGSIFNVSGYMSYVGIIPDICSMYFIYKLFLELSDVSDKYACPQTSSLRFCGIANVVLTAVTSVFSYLALIFSDVEIFVFVGGLFFLLIGLIIMLGSMITLFKFSGALMDVLDSSLPEVQVVEEVNPFGDGAQL